MSDLQDFQGLKGLLYQVLYDLSDFDQALELYSMIREFSFDIQHRMEFLPDQAQIKAIAKLKARMKD